MKQVFPSHLKAAQAAEDADEQAKIALDKAKQAQALSNQTAAKIAFSANQLPSIVASFPPITPADAMVLAQQILAARGLSAEWSDFNYIISRESGWNITAQNNPNNSESACGLPQANPCSKIAGYAADAQITWAINYMIGAYGSIHNAYLHWLVFHSY